MRTTRLWFAALLPVALALGCDQAEEVNLDSDDQKAVYGLGAQIGEDLKSRLGALSLTPDETSTLLAGINDQFAGTTRIDIKDPAQAGRFDSFRRERMKSMASEETTGSAAFLEKAAQESGAVKTESGLVYTEVEAGKGGTPTPTDVVKVHYHGTLRDGSVFDSSRERGEPVEFPVNGVIPCWTEGLQKMKEGGKAKFVCPAAIAYGDSGAPPKIKPGAALAFDVELISITKPEAQAPAPAN
jgi:FKBP-type peptidyl-prolyl cis-trans isomerase FkpA